MSSRLTRFFECVLYRGYQIIQESSGFWIFSEDRDCYIDGPFDSAESAKFKIDQYLE